jgi:hypothetical protein
MPPMAATVTIAVVVVVSQPQKGHFIGVSSVLLDISSCTLAKPEP